MLLFTLRDFPLPRVISPSRLPLPLAGAQQCTTFILTAFTQVYLYVLPQTEPY